MAIQDCAQAAVDVFPNTIIQTPYGAFSAQVIFLALGGPESNWENIHGDPGIENTCNPPGTLCNGYGSFGWLQMSLSCNGDEIAQVSGIPASDPCGQANWLMTSYENCARAALLAWQNRGGGAKGFEDWCTWWGDARCGTEGGQPGYGPYQNYLTEAQNAVDAISSTGGGSSPGGAPGTAFAVAGVLFGIAIVVAGLIGFEEVEGAQVF